LRLDSICVVVVITTARGSLFFIKMKEIPEYEKSRLENIKRNAEVLKSMGIESIGFSSMLKKPSKKGTPIQKRKKVKGVSKKPKKILPSRSSLRILGQEPDPIKLSENIIGETDPEQIDKNGLMDMDVYCKLKGFNPVCVSDGKFRGWVDPTVCEKFSLAKSEKEQKEQKKKGAKTSSNKMNGWSSAKSQAYRMLQLNPNSYFYRHCAPGEDQSMGEWTQEEYDLFIEVSKKYGCGDQWGLFSSYIPNRVGYQCSNFYRQFALPDGKIIDPNYKMDSSGKAIFCGRGRSDKADDVVQQE